MVRRGTRARRLPPKPTSRVRTASPVDVRYWITKLPAEEDILTDLVRRIEILEQAAKPLARQLLAVIPSMLLNAATALGHTGKIPALPNASERALARVLGANLVATYWHEYEFEPGIVLPRIVTLGAPWLAPPDTIHVLDLPAAKIQFALSLLRVDEARKPLTVALSGSRWTAPDLFQMQVTTALATGRELGPATVFDPWFLVTLFLSLMHARYNPSKEGARVAARDANHLLDTLRPDLSRRMTRVPHQLSDTLTRFEDLHQKALEICNALAASGPTRPLLSRARDSFGGRIDTRDLTRWKRMSPHAIASEILAAETHLRPKVVRDQLRLAAKAKEIEESWDAFQAHLLTLSEEMRNRIAFFPAEPPATPPTPAA
jgi:hypothetical protein